MSSVLSRQMRPSHPMSKFTQPSLILSVLLLAFSLIGCSSGEKFDPRTVETDAGAALFRHLMKECPLVNDTTKVCLTIGAEQAAPSNEFLTRFADMKDRLLKHNQITVISLNGKSRVIERSDTMVTGNLALLLQITEMNSASGGYQAVAAWAFKDDMMRRKYTVTPTEGGAFTITPGDIIEQKPTPQ